MAALPNVDDLVLASRPQWKTFGDGAKDTFVGDFGATNEVSVADGALVTDDLLDKGHVPILFFFTVSSLIKCTGAPCHCPCIRQLVVGPTLIDVDWRSLPLAHAPSCY